MISKKVESRKIEICCCKVVMLNMKTGELEIHTLSHKQLLLWQTASNQWNKIECKIISVHKNKGQSKRKMEKENGKKENRKGIGLNLKYQ